VLPAIVLVGDMNQHDNCNNGVSELLTKGVVHPDYVEDGEILTSKPKTHSLGLFSDVYEVAFRAQGLEPPPTMVCAEISCPFSPLAPKQQRPAA
jgi:hypothetical protein